MIANKDIHFMNTALELASASRVKRAQLGCVAVANGKIISSGTNSYRTHSRNGLLKEACSCHAEMTVVHDLLKKYGNGGHWQCSLKGA